MPTGGLDTTAATAARGPMIGKIAGMHLYGGLTIETTLDPAIQPFLHDHQIEGKPVLPGVMGIEAFAEAALCMLPGWHVEAIEDVNFLAPFKFYRGEPRTVTIEAVFRPQGESVVADCRLNGSRSLPNQTEPQVTTHFTARVRLTKQAARDGPGAARSASRTDPWWRPPDIYRVFFHGPAYQVLERAWLQRVSHGGPVLQRPARQSLSARAAAGDGAPVDRAVLPGGGASGGCRAQGRIGLAAACWAKSRLWRSPDLAEGPLYAVVTPAADGDSFDAEVVDAAGNRYVHLRGYKMVAHPDAVDVEPLRALKPSGARLEMDVHWLEQTCADLPAGDDWLSAGEAVALERHAIC